MSRDASMLLLDACGKGDLETVKTLMPNVDIHRHHNILYDALFNVCVGGHYDLCLYLYNYAIEIDYEIRISDINTLLWIAGYSGKQHIMHWLIDIGATDHRYMTYMQTVEALNHGYDVKNQHTMSIITNRQKKQSHTTNYVQQIYDDTPQSYYDSKISTIFQEYIAYE